MKKLGYLVVIYSLSISVIVGQRTISKQDSLQILALNDLAYDYLFTNIDSSLIYAQKQLERAEKSGSRSLIGSSYGMLSSAYLYKNELDSALNYIKKSLIISQQLNDQKTVGKNYTNLALIYDKLNKNDSSLLTYNKSLNVFKQLNDSNELATAYMNLGSLIFMKFHKNDTAISIFKKAEEYAVNNPRVLSGVYQNLGTVYKNKGQTALALNYYLKSLAIVKDNEKEVFMLPLFINISSIYINDQNYKKAREYIQKCFKLAENSTYKEGTCRANHQKGLLLYALKENDSAAYYFKAAIDLALTENVIDVKKEAYHYLAQLQFSNFKNTINSSVSTEFYLSKNNYKQADSIHHYIALSKLNDSKSTYSKTLLKNIFLEAQLLEVQNRTVEALALYKSAFTTASANNWLDLQLEIAQNTSSLLESINLFKEALAWEKTTKQLTDSIYNLRKQNQLESIKIELEKNIELTTMKEISNKNELNLQKERTKNISILLGLLVIIFALVLYIVLTSVKKKNQHLKQVENQKKMIEMELLILRSQMNPHFLFNTIQSIQSYILQNDSKNSYQYLTKFSALLRSIINNSKLTYISISEEIEILTNYIELEQMRMDHKFSFKINCDPSILNDKIQPMLLQPLVENAIVHGFATRTADGLLTISFKKENEFLSIEVADNGIGRKASSLNPSTHKSVAIANIKERLASFDKGELTYIDKIEDGKSVGTTAIIKIATA